MSRAASTHPLDLVVALHLSVAQGTLKQLGDALALAPSQVHGALGRLEAAGLLKHGARAVNGRALLEFLVHGVRYAFPARRERLATGIPTAYSAPPLSADVDATDVLVWPAPTHPAAVQGFSVRPLYRTAPALIDRAPETYRLVALVDALRLGDPRVRLPARTHLEAALAGR